MVLSVYFWSDEKELLQVAELCSTAITGIFGIAGVFAETKSSKETGKLNIKGWLTIIGLIVGSCFTIWLKQRQHQLEEKNATIQKTSQDSIANKRNQEYLYNIAHLQLLQSSDTDIIRRQTRLSVIQGKSLTGLKHLSREELQNIDLQFRNLGIQQNILHTSTIVSYPLEDLQGFLHMQFNFSAMAPNDLEKLKNLLIQNHKKHQLLFYDAGVSNYDDRPSTIRAISFYTDSLNRLKQYSFDSPEGQLIFMIGKYFSPEISLEFLKDPHQNPNDAFGTLNISDQASYLNKLRFDFSSNTLKTEYLFDHESISPNFKTPDLESLNQLNRCFMTFYTLSYIQHFPAKISYFLLKTKTFRELDFFPDNSGNTGRCTVK